MCKKLFSLPVFALLFCLPSVAPAAQEAGRWFLISDAELTAIERYREKSETDRASWLLRVQGLKAESTSLNARLAAEREATARLEKSFNELETDRLIRLSSKDAEISTLENKLAVAKLEAQKYKGNAKTRLVIIVSLVTAIVAYIAFRIMRISHLGPL